MPYAKIADVQKESHPEYMEVKSKEQYTQDPGQSAEYEQPVKLISSENQADITNTDNEDAYEEMIDFMKKTFNPSQMHAMVTMLQSVKQSMRVEEAKDSGTLLSPVPLSPLADGKKHESTSHRDFDDKIRVLGMLLKVNSPVIIWSIELVSKIQNIREGLACQ